MGVRLGFLSVAGSAGAEIVGDQFIRRRNPGGREHWPDRENFEEREGLRKRHVGQKRGDAQLALEEVVDLGLPARVLHIP